MRDSVSRRPLQQHWGNWFVAMIIKEEMNLAYYMSAGKDLWCSKHMRVDQSFIDAKEGLVATGSNPCSLAPVLGSYVRHGCWFCIPVRDIQNWPAKLPFLKMQVRDSSMEWELEKSSVLLKSVMALKINVKKEILLIGIAYTFYSSPNLLCFSSAKVCTLDN